MSEANTTPTPVTLSRDAQIVAYCLFGFGKPASLTFERPHIIHPRTLAALEELVAAGRIKPMDGGVLPQNAKGWKATDLIGNPMKDFRAPKKSESWPITTE